VEFRSAGSIFKNPPGDYAGRLVEAAGLKGSRIGDAMVSEKHGNFFVNLRQARAADVLALVALAQERVRATAGIELELEIRVVGED
jgi:UDP-N-acetylmuramate dehydrogenase